MQWNQKLSISMTVMVGLGIMGLAGCGGQKIVKTEPTPVAAVATEEPTPVPNSSQNTESIKHTVVHGDSLWKISGAPEIYGDHFQWPLIFKANRDQIQDPDMIEVGQDLAISKVFSQADIAQAIENAKKTPRYKKHTLVRKRLPIEY